MTHYNSNEFPNLLEVEFHPPKPSKFAVYCQRDKNYHIMFFFIFILFPSMQGGISEDSEFEHKVHHLIVYNDYEGLF